MRERQRATLTRIPAELAARVRWLDHLPEQIEGVVLANGLLDALPVRLFVADCGQVMERGVVHGALIPRGKTRLHGLIEWQMLRSHSR
jgi:SAM-dependent MidA family methyltransferase